MKVNFHRGKENPRHGSEKPLAGVVLGRRNLTDEERTYTIGKQCEAEKMTQGMNNQYAQAKSEKPQNEAFQKGKTSERIAKQHGIGHATVERAEKFAKGVDTAEKISPGPLLQWVGCYILTR